MYATDGVDQSPLASSELVLHEMLDRATKQAIENKDERERKRLKIIDSRFGAVVGNNSTDEVDESDKPREATPMLDDDSALTRVEFRLENEYRGEFGESFLPKVRILIEGTHVFSGLRQMAIKGLIDERNMPAWVTGELGVSAGIILNGQYTPLKD